MSNDRLLQYIFNPMLRPVSCDTRGTFDMLASVDFDELLLAQDPHHSVS